MSAFEMLMRSADDKLLLLRHWPLGVPSDFASREAISTPSTIDELDASFMPQGALFIDIGPGPGSPAAVKIAASYDGTEHEGELVAEMLALFRDAISEVAASLAGMP